MSRTSPLSPSLFQIVSSQWNKKELTLIQFSQIEIHKLLENAQAKDICVIPPQRDPEGFLDEEPISPTIMRQNDTARKNLEQIEQYQMIARNLRTLEEIRFFDPEITIRQSLEEQLNKQTYGISTNETREFLLRCFDEFCISKDMRHSTPCISIEGDSPLSSCSPTQYTN